MAGVVDTVDLLAPVHVGYEQEPLVSMVLHTAETAGLFNAPGHLAPVRARARGVPPHTLRTRHASPRMTAPRTRRAQDGIWDLDEEAPASDKRGWITLINPSSYALVADVRWAVGVGCQLGPAGAGRPEQLRTGGGRQVGGWGWLGSISWGGSGEASRDGHGPQRAG